MFGDSMAVDHCAKSPLDPRCGNYANNSTNTVTGWFPNRGATTTSSQTAPNQIVTTTTPFATGILYSGGGPWYKTWWGLGLIGVAAFFGYKKFIAKK